MAYHSFYSVERGIPALRKAIWRSFYGLLAKRFTMPQWTFMNYGYWPEEGENTPVLDSADESDRSCIQLYAHVFDGHNLEGLDVLEVGSGRGGGAAWIARTQGVNSMTGVDLSGNAVEFCRERHLVENLVFMQGDAEDLPLVDQSLDVVINVESCHHYPDQAAFFREVHRVLRPGGHFFLTDYRDADELDAFHQAIAGAPFEVIRQRDITANVVAALDHDNESKRELIDATVPRIWRGVIEHFAAMQGTDMYRRFAERDMLYESYQLRRS